MAGPGVRRATCVRGRRARGVSTAAIRLGATARGVGLARRLRPSLADYSRRDRPWCGAREDRARAEMRGWRTACRRRARQQDV